jgi:hypothetical protein
MVLLLSGPAQALPAVEWRFPAYPLRTVFHAPSPASTSVLLRVDRVGNMPVTRDGFLACGPEGAPLPLRVVCADKDEVVLTIEAPGFGSRPCAVYYGSRSAPEPVTSPEAAADPMPLSVGFRPLRGRAIPTSWERLRHMLKSPLGQIETPHRVADFDSIGQAVTATSETPGRRGRRQQGPGVRVALVRSFLLCPRGGSYRFAIDCMDAGFVVVDGEVAAAWPGEHEAREWQPGVPLSLKAGVHRIEVFNAFDGRDPDLRVGWIPPGLKEVVPLGAPDLIASCEAMETRAERLNRTLQPGFVATPLQAYSFRGDPNVFVAVQFKNITENWITPEMESRWRFGDGTQSTEVDPRHVFTASDVFKASLEVRDALGFVARSSDSVDCRQLPPEEYAVSFDLTGIPAVCFSRDKVAPFLRLQGAGPTSVAFEVSWEIQLRSGASEQGRREISLGGKTALVPLSPVGGAEVESLRWHVRHRQVELGGEMIRFLRPPFEVLPARIEGDRLYDAAGTRLVLVPEEGVSSFRQPTPAPVPARRLGRLVCVDDSLGVAGFVEPGAEPFDRILARLLEGRMEDVRYAPLPEWSQFPDSYGPLRTLVDVPVALIRERADVAILSIGLRDILELKDVERFERQAAALSDLVAVSMKIRTVWVTPPPYPSAPERSRVFAAAIRRVAEARGIPVADLFTAFRCATDSRHVFFQDNPLMLSDPGHKLVGQQIVRALMGE